MKLAIKGGGSLIDKGIKAFIALSITITLPKEYSKEKPHRNIRKKIRARIFERKSAKEYLQEY